MRSLRPLLPLFVLFVVVLSGSAIAQDAEQVLPIDPPQRIDAGAPVDETPSTWFVELASPPTADGTSLATVQNEKKAFRTAARKAGLQFTERYAFDTLFNGLSIRISRADLSKLSRIDGVKAIWPVIVIDAPEPRAPISADLFTAINMTGASVVQTELGFTGAGVRVGIIDTGSDIDHPDLGGGGTNGGTAFPGGRFVAGYDFVGDAYNADPTSPAYNPVPTPDENPDDCGGHGTHVTGIVGANGTVKGVAPGVVFGAYRVFGCAGSTSADIMIAAMERALADGMQIINMSIGSSYQWPQYPTAMAATRMVNRGVVVVCSIGNAGANGLYSASAPGVGEKVIGLASVDNTFVYLPAFSIAPDGRLIGYNAATGAPAPPVSGTNPMIRTGTPSSAADACATTGALPDLTGKIALIRRGTCGFYEKSRRAQLAGAVGVVLYNNTTGLLSPTVAVVVGVADGQPVTIPVVAITAADGVAINSFLAAGAVNLTWTGTSTSVPNPTGGLISSFSSYGLSPDLSVKPDLSAPGGSIYSTYPIELGSYATLGGTSMASPHAAGAAALLLQAKPNTPSQAVRAIFQNSAQPGVWWGNPPLGLLDNVHRQGAGLLRIDRSILATARVEPSRLALGESQAGPAARTLTLSNSSSSPATYDLSHTPALSTGPNTFTPAFFTGFATVAFTSLGVPVTSVAVPANSSASVDVTITANAALADRSMYGGYLVFTPQGGGQTLRVPYAGFKGDYQSIPVITPTPNNFPWLAQIVGASYVNRPTGATYTMVGTNVPFVLIHLDHQSRLLRFEVVDAVSGKSWHRAFQQEYLGRNSSATSFFAFSWDGLTTAGNKTYTVPNGQYLLKLTLVKALGSEANPTDVETWTSPVITIARP